MSCRSRPRSSEPELSSVPPPALGARTGNVSTTSSSLSIARVIPPASPAFAATSTAAASRSATNARSSCSVVIRPAARASSRAFRSAERIGPDRPDPIGRAPDPPAAPPTRARVTLIHRLRVGKQADTPPVGLRRERREVRGSPPTARFEAKTGRNGPNRAHQARDGPVVHGLSPRPELPGQVQPGVWHPRGWRWLCRCAAFQLVGSHSSWGWVVAGWMWSRELAPGWWQSQQVPLSRWMTHADAVVTRRPVQVGRPTSWGARQCWTRGASGRRTGR